MKVTFSGNLDRELRQLMVNQKVTIEVTFDVDNTTFDIDDDGYESIGGQVRVSRVTNKTGSGGLSPLVEMETRRLRNIRTHGTHG